MSKTRNILLLLFSILLLIFTIFGLHSQSNHPSSLLEQLYHGNLQQLILPRFNLPIFSHEETTDFNTQELHVKPPVIHVEKDVVEVLTGKNFSSFIAEKKFVVVNFYAPWLHWSQKLAPEFEAAASLLKGEVAFAKVNALRETELAGTYRVSAYPKVFLFVGGFHKPYDVYERTRDGIVSWVRSCIGVQNVIKKDDAERILAMDSMKVVGFFNTLKGPETEELIAASELHPDVNFYQTASPEIAKIFHIDPQIKQPALVMLKKEAVDFIQFDGSLTRLAIAEFVSSNKPSFVTTFTEERSPWNFQSPEKQLWLLETKSESRKVKSAFEEASKALGQEELHVKPPVIHGDHEKDVVEVLTGKNFSSFIAEKKFVMVNFYATWCYWSQKLAPEFEAAASLLKGEVAFAKVDAPMETELAWKYEVSGYPTMFLFVGRVHKPYYYERTRDGIVSWVRNCIGVQNVTKKDDAERILAMDSMKVVGFFDTLEGPETEELIAASKLHLDVDFYHTASLEIAKIFHIDPQIKQPALVLLKKEAKDFSQFDGSFTRLAIADFVSSNKPTCVTTFTEERAPWIFQSPKKQLWLLETKSETRKVKSAFEEASKALGQELLFVYAEIGHDDTGRRLASRFELNVDAPRIIATSRYAKKYLFNGDITSTTIKSFGEDFLDDKIPDTLELIPESLLRLRNRFWASDPSSFPHVAYT